MIIVDFSGICLASILIHKTLDEAMVRHMTLNSLRMYNKKFRDQYGEVILACDGGRTIGGVHTFLSTKVTVEKIAKNLHSIGMKLSVLCIPLKTKYVKTSPTKLFI